MFEASDPERDGRFGSTRMKSKDFFRTWVKGRKALVAYPAIPTSKVGKTGVRTWEIYI
jgi:hypothetical protein